MNITINKTKEISKMKQVVDEISINGIPYIRKDAVPAVAAIPHDGLPYQIVRTYSAGVFAGYIVSRNGREVKLTQARRLWFWEGANSLSEMATHGTMKPNNCKFACPVDVLLLEVVEILDVTEKAQACIQGVKVWQP